MRICSKQCSWVKSDASDFWTQKTRLKDGVGKPLTPVRKSNQSSLLLKQNLLFCCLTATGFLCPEVGMKEKVSDISDLLT